jgi:transcription initiation factor IIE alpha subunit
MTLFDDDQILKAYTKDIEDNATYREARQTAERMIRKGKMTIEEIADYVPVLSLEELKKLEAEIMQLV